MTKDQSNPLPSATPTTPPPPAILLQMMTGYWVSQAIYVAAKLGVADLLADGPQPVEALATATQVHAPSLHRVLRALASVGIFTEAKPTHLCPDPHGLSVAHKHARFDGRAGYHVRRRTVPRLGQRPPQRAHR